MGELLKIAFVGIGRDGKTIPADYLETFVRFHLELPWYYARHSKCDVSVFILNAQEEYRQSFSVLGGGEVRVVPIPDEDSISRGHDVVVHWRKWCQGGHDPWARNVLLSQDHSYGQEWLDQTGEAIRSDQLHGMLVFPKWHHLQMALELGRSGIQVPPGFFIPGLTLGVDPDVYHPTAHKDPYHLLWASDPGRGLWELVPIFLGLYRRDKRYRLTVTYPDYVRQESVQKYQPFFAYPGVKHLPGLRNGPDLWDLFNSSGVLPYSSEFLEPSSRCHRQAMAAASLVLYPPDRGTPSELIDDGVTGLVRRPHEWADLIHETVSSGRWQEIGENARIYARSESWAVQAQRFHRQFGGEG